MAVKLKNGGFQGKSADKWYVTDGMNAVGPVELTLLVRGVEAGRVPLDSFVRHEAWKVWRPLADFAESDGVPEPIPTTPHPLSSLLEQERAIAHGSSLGDTGDLIDDPPSTGDYGDRLTIEVLSEMSPATDHAPSMADEVSVEVPTQLSRDLLGGDRPTLASYIDDEETKIPEKKISAPPAVVPQPTSSPARLSASAPPRPASFMPPRPASFQPPPNSGLLPLVARSSSKPGTEPLVNDDDDDDEGKTSPSVKPPRIPPPGSLPEVRIDELEGATDLADALHLLLDSLVRHVRAEAALLHRMADDGATVVCAHGPNMVSILGTRVRLLDPTLVAAAGGNVVVAEPAPGPAGDVLLARLRKLGLDAEGAAMLPIRPKSRLLGFVEIGKAQRFSFRELAIAEELVALFVTRAEQSGWS
jgi:hypothetical protein